MKQSMNHSQRFLVSTKSKEHLQSMPWDSSEPLLFGRSAQSSGYLLEKTDDGNLRVRQLCQNEKVATKAYSKVIPLNQARKGAQLRFQKEQEELFEVNIHEIESLRVSDFRRTEGVDFHSGFIVYSTIGDWTTQMSVHRKEYRAFWLKQELFRIQMTGNGARVTSKKAGLFFELDSKWVEIREGTEQFFTESEFLKTSLKWDNQQWYFTGVVPSVKDPVFDVRTVAKDEGDFQKATGLSLILLFLFFVGGKVLNPLLPSLNEVEKPLPPQLVKLLKKKERKIKAQKKLEIPGEKTPDEQKVAAKSPEPQPKAAAPDQMVIPKGNPPPVKEANNKPIKGKSEPKSVAKATQPPKNRISNIASGAFLGGLQKMISSDALLKTAKSGHEGKFKGDAKSFASAISGIQMNVDQSGTGSLDSKVAGFGGKDGAGARGPASVGYGEGVKSGVLSGNGSSQITLGIKDAEIDEGLTRDEVGRVIHQHMKEVRYCYESSMVRAPASEVKGQVSLAFTINSGGSVSKSSVAQSSVPDPALGDCIRKRLGTWKFPKPKGGVTVNITYPFIFNTLGGG